MARAFRRCTIVLPQAPSDQTFTVSGLSYRKASLFCAWIFAMPAGHGEIHSHREGEIIGHRPFAGGVWPPERDLIENAMYFFGDNYFKHPIPDGTFWDQED